MELQIDIEQLKKGDDREFKHLYEHYFPLFLSFARRFRLPEESCYNIVQEVFIAYLNIRHQFSDVVSLKVFFYRSIRNRCLNMLRDTALETCDIDVLNDVSSSDYLEEAIIEEEISDILYREISKLPKEQRDIITLSLQGLNNQEIANKLALSINTVKKRKMAAYSSLRISLKDLHILAQILSII